MKHPRKFSAPLRYHGLVAVVLLLATASVWSTLSPGYLHGLHPLSLLGAKGMPQATAFNALAYVVPGLIAAHLGWGLRRYWHARWASRIGGNVLMLSGLAFAAQGVLPLDPGDLDGAASQRQAAAWMLWWLAFVVGTALLAWGERGRDKARTLVRCSALAAMALTLLAVVLPQLIAPALAQRAGVGVWLLWLVIAGRVSRSAA